MPDAMSTATVQYVLIQYVIPRNATSMGLNGAKPGSGIIIGPHTILTAAHVVEFPNGNLVTPGSPLNPNGISIYLPSFFTNLNTLFNHPNFKGSDNTFEIIPFGATIDPDGGGEKNGQEEQTDYAVINFNSDIFAGQTYYELDTQFKGGSASPVNTVGVATPDGVTGKHLLPDPTFSALWNWADFVSVAGNSGGPDYLPGTNLLVGINDTNFDSIRITPAVAALIELAEHQPVVTGTRPGLVAPDQEDVLPFRETTITDLNPGPQIETVTVTPSSPAYGQFLAPASGVVSNGTYSITGSPTNVTTALDNLVFAPAYDQIAANQTVTTGFTISVVDSSGYTSTDATTSVVAQGPVPSTGTTTIAVEATSPAPGTGTPISYDVIVELTPTDVVFPTERQPLADDNPTTIPIPVTVTFEGGNLYPLGLDDVYIGPSATNTSDFTVSSVDVGPQNSTGTIYVSNLLPNDAVGDFSNEILPVAISYDGSSEDYDLSASLRIYAPAVAAYGVQGNSEPAYDFGVIHVGDTVSVDVDITNVATGSLTDTLISSPGIEDQFYVTNGVTLAAGQTGEATVLLTGDIAGSAEADSALFDFTTHDDDLLDTTAQASGLPLIATINNYATAAFAVEGNNPGTLSQDGSNSWTLDMGSISETSSNYPDATILLQNAAPASYSDVLTGTISSAGTGFNYFTVPSVNAIAGIGAVFGEFIPDLQSFGTNQLVVTLHDFSTNNSGSTALPDVTLTVIDNVVPSLAGASVVIQGQTITVTVAAGEESFIDPLLDGGYFAADTLILQGPGSADILQTGSVATLEVAAGGDLNLYSSIYTDPVAVDADGNLSGSGTVSGTLTDNGSITANGGTLELSGDITGDGSLVILPGATLRLDGTVGAGIKILFESEGGGTLQLVDPAAVLASITGQAPGDTVSDVACFLAGTRIATPRGEVPIERLVIGGLVHTELHGLQPISWIGSRAIDCRRHPEPERVWPVSIAAGAFGDGTPDRDLFLSPNHAIYAEAVLIPVRCLINGTSVCQEPRDNVIYFHIELDQHDVLLAENMPCESLLPGGDRSAFGGHGATQLYSDFHSLAWEALGCAKLVVIGPELDAVRRRLCERQSKVAGSIGVLSRLPCSESVIPTASSRYRFAHR